ncbi:unnamed protein product [Urochloa decumbens]|uniref:Uncharacterized protein n=1 Tax=Urochloa decumbens TaxID=240449 RepID=A0ABC8XAM4_9POAL
MSRPDRSDAHLSPEAEAAREAEVREYFDDAAPKRHTKPFRSDHSAVYADALVPDTSHPELDKFQDLEAHTERLVCEGGKAGEEFVETEYYKDLGGVGKQHHTTGTGFIRMDRDKGASFKLSEDPDAAERHASCKGNPATNEWIPSADTVRSQHHSQACHMLRCRLGTCHQQPCGDCCFVSGVPAVRQAEQKRQLSLVPVHWIEFRQVLSPAK